MPRLCLICWLFSLLLLAGCSTEPVSAPVVNNPVPQRQTKKPVDTAKSYALADTQAGQHLLNVENFLRSGNTQAATHELDIINYANLPIEQRSKFNLLDGQVSLSDGEAEQALTKMANIRPKLLSDADRITYYQSLAFAYSLTGNIVQGVTARMRLGSLLQDPQQQQDNIVSILDALSNLSPDETLSAPQTTMDDLKGWTALAKVLKQRNQPEFNVNKEIDQWRQQYPKHPANVEFLKTYLASHPWSATSQTAGTNDMTLPVPANGTNTPNIAVLLPASGSLAQAGKAIKEGLLAAQQLASKTAPQPPLKFYDTEQGEIADLYKEALAAGAKQIIGPLVKEQLQALARHADFSVPVLALNHVEDLIKPNLYQFGLSPIDEAEQLADKAWQDGRQTAVLLTPNTSQGQRISQYLTVAWQSNGGTITGMQSYDPKQHDIKDMFNALLTATVDPTKPNQPQTVFLSANPEVARELALQVKYQQNVDLAVYAMPNIYSGRPDPGKDAELGKIKFCDIPWFFADAYKGPLSQAALQNNWQNFTDTQIRLFAMGIDAYNLLDKLSELNSKSYLGVTGHLGINSDNRITRKLVCAQFQGGMPVSSGFIEP